MDKHRTFLIVLLIAAALTACTAASSPQPLPEIPRMPGAIDESPTERGMEYLVYAPLSEVEAFYISELRAAGWEYHGLGEGVGGVFLTFIRGDKTLDISAYKTRADAYTRVVLGLRPFQVPPPNDG